jgi:chemotaxis family two-component system response regulator Rcp1
MIPDAQDRPKEILLVEDSIHDSKMVSWALGRNGRGKRLVTVVDGEEAMGHLRQDERIARPDLILLDLNLPKKDGWEVLAECKADFQLRSIPIVIFSTSQLQSEVKRAYDLGANSFVAKPFDLEEFQRAIEMIENYWLGLSRSPL